MPPATSTPRDREGNPRIDFRVSEQEKQAIKRLASQRGQSTAEFSRTAVLKALADEHAFEISLKDRLNQAVADLAQIQQFLPDVTQLMKRLEALAAAAVASSALIRDDGTLVSEAGRQMVTTHIKTALLAADYVLQTHGAQGAPTEAQARAEG
jgi:uncharacterized protein (DUF1778 family)